MKASTLLRETYCRVALEHVLLLVHNHEAVSLIVLPDVTCAEVAHTNDGDEVLIVPLLDLPGIQSFADQHLARRLPILSTFTSAFVQPLSGQSRKRTKVPGLCVLSCATATQEAAIVSVMPSP